MGKFNKIISCEQCRQRKVRCNRMVPCATCIRHGWEAQCSLNFSATGQPASTSARNKTLIPRFGISAASDTLSTTSPFESSNVSESERESGIKVTSKCEENPSSTSASYWCQYSHHTIEALHNLWNCVSICRPSQARFEAPAFTGFAGSITREEQQAWLVHLAAQLPPRAQCDLLVSYFFENINWIYQSVSGSSFMRLYDRIWSLRIEEVELGAMSLLFIIISSSALYINPRVCDSFGMDGTNIQDKSRSWFRLSRQALHADECEAQPKLIHIQIFVVSQVYWFATKAVEALNSALGQAVRCAQALDLDKDCELSTNSWSEMRHRLWWDLCCADTFQALCLDRQPLIQVHSTRVPIPRNCDDIDMSATGIVPHPDQEPTRMSAHVVRAKLIKTMSKLFINNSPSGLSYEETCAIDAEILTIIDQSPWFMSWSSACGIMSTSLPPAYDYLQWQHHLVHNFVCIQRIRMYRPFLRTAFRNVCWSKCVDAVESAFGVYHAIRQKDPASFQRSEKMLVQSYQIFSAAISTALFLLVERPMLSHRILNDLEVVMQDLKQLAEGDRQIPMAKDGRATLAKIISFYHSTFCQETGLDDRKLSESQISSTLSNLVQEVYTIMGGRLKTRDYLRQHVSSELVGNTIQTSDEYDLSTRSTFGSDPYLTDVETQSSLRSIPAAHNYGFDSMLFDQVGQNISPDWIYSLQFDVTSWAAGSP